MSQTILRPSVSTTSLRRAQKKLAAIEHRGVLETRLFASRLRARASRAFKNGEKLQILDIVLKSLPALRDAMIASHLLGTIAYSTPRDLALSSVYSPLIKVLKAQSTANYNKLQKLYGTRALKVLNGVSKAAESELRGTVNELVEKGSHVSEAIDVLGEKIESLGLAPKKDYQLEAIFRTQSQIAFGAGRWEADKDPAVQEILWGYEYSATMDDRTRESHAALDGVKLPKDDPFWEKFWPPNGWNCRCVAIPIFSDEAVEVEPPDDVEPDEGFDFNPGIVFGSGEGTSLGLSHDFEDGWRMAFDPDQPRDEIGRWTSTGASNPHPAVKKMKDKVSKSIYNKLAAINDKGLAHNTIYVPNAMSKEEIMVLEKYLHPGQKIKKINAAKYIKQQKEAKAPPPVLEPEIGPKTSSFNVLEKLGGSTGAELVEMSDGSLKVKKSGASKEHVKSEHAADQAYAAAGVKVASGYLTKDPETGHTIKLAGFIKGKTLGELSGEERAAAEKQLAKGFMADVLLANYDAVGMNADNVIVNGQGVWRIDNGGSLSFRAQGEKKANWTGHSVLDLYAMSNSLQNPQMAKIAKHLTKADMVQQVKDLKKNISSIKSALSSEDADVVEKRLKNLEDHLGVSYETPEPKPPPTTGGQHAVVAIAKSIGTTKGIISKLEAINTDPGSKVIQVPKAIKPAHLAALKKAFPEHVFKPVNAAAIIKKKYKENFPDSEKQSIGVKASTYDGSRHVVKATNTAFTSHAQDKGFKNEFTDEFKQLNKKWIEGLSSSAKKAIKYWTGTGSTAIRASQLKGKPNQEAKLIEAAIAKAPKAEGVFYRGIKHVSAETLTKMTTVGAEFPEKCTHSMSRSYEFARNWSAGKILMRIKTKSATSIETLGLSGEYELYGSAYTRYKVVAVHENKNGVEHIIDVEEISNGQ